MRFPHTCASSLEGFVEKLLYALLAAFAVVQWGLRV